MITSADNKSIKYVMKLLSKAKQREEDGVFVIEGRRIFEEACMYAADRIDTVYLAESFETANRDFLEDHMKKGAGVFAERGKNNAGNGFDGGFRIETVSDGVFEKMCDTVSPQGVLAIIKRDDTNTKEIFDKANVKLMILDRLQDPGNLGTVLRTAEAAGFDAVVLGNDTADIYNPKVIRSTMGAIFRVPVIRPDEELSSYMKGTLKNAGIKTFAACIDGAKPYDSVSYPEKTAIIVGNEGNGICREVQDAADERIYIPMEGKTESLNAAVSAAILMYNVKQRK